MKRKLLVAIILIVILGKPDLLVAQTHSELKTKTRVDFEWLKAGAQIVVSPLFLGQQALIHEIGHCVPAEIFGDCKKIEVNPFTFFRHSWVGRTWYEVDGKGEDRIVSITPHFVNVGLIVGGDLMFRSLVSTDSWTGWYV